MPRAKVARGKIDHWLTRGLRERKAVKRKQQSRYAADRNEEPEVPSTLVRGTLSDRDRRVVDVGNGCDRPIAHDVQLSIEDLAPNIPGCASIGGVELKQPAQAVGPFLKITETA